MLRGVLGGDEELPGAFPGDQVEIVTPLPPAGCLIRAESKKNARKRGLEVICRTRQKQDNGDRLESDLALVPGQTQVHVLPTRAIRKRAGYFASAAFFMASSSFLMSAGDSCGRSSLMVSWLSFAVSGNGGR